MSFVIAVEFLCRIIRCYSSQFAPSSDAEEDLIRTQPNHYGIKMEERGLLFLPTSSCGGVVLEQITYVSDD